MSNTCQNPWTQTQVHTLNLTEDVDPEDDTTLQSIPGDQLSPTTPDTTGDKTELDF